MDKVKRFFRRTKTSSRVLVLAWIMILLLLLVGEAAGLADVDSKWILLTAHIFLVPVLIIELCGNPVLLENDSKFFRFLSETKIISRILFGCWLLFGTLSVGYEAAYFIYSIPLTAFCTLLPAVVIEADARIKKGRRWKQKMERRAAWKKQTGGRYIGPCRILGFAALAFAVLMAILGLSSNSNPETYAPNNLYPAYTFGAVGVILLLISLRDPKTQREAMERRQAEAEKRRVALYQKAIESGVYLSIEQIEKLEKGIELPLVDVPVFLHAGEFAVYFSKATRQIIKNRIIGSTGSYGGGSFSLTKNLSVHAGESASQAVYGDVPLHYEGRFVITNERVIFLSDQKGFELRHSKLTAATVYLDAMSFQAGSHSYVVLLPYVRLAAQAFDGIRLGEIPVAAPDGMRSGADVPEE